MVNRNVVERFYEKDSEPMDNHRNNKKISIQRGIISGALIVIIIALLVIPKFEAYRDSRLMLAEKIRYNLDLPDKMTEEHYLEQLKSIGEQLNETLAELPERMDTVNLYEVVAKVAESTKVNLTSLEFGVVNFQIDDQLGLRIDDDFEENIEKTIKGPDGKFLTKCEFTVVCSGNDESFMAFLDALNQCKPVIRVISYEVEKGSAENKLMRLKLESYVVQEENQNNTMTEVIYQQEKTVAP